MLVRFVSTFTLSVITLSCVSTAVAGNDARIDATLHAAFADAGRGDIISALIFMHEQGDIDRLATDLDQQVASFAQRHEEVVRQLRDTAAVTQADLLDELTMRRDAGEVRDFEAYWIANIIRVDATEDVLRDIARRPDVQRVYHNFAVEGIEPIRVDDARNGKAIGPTLAGLDAVRAPEVWNMGYTGNDVLVATIDSGIDADHPALASRWRGLDPDYANNPNWAWFDPLDESDLPVEFDSDSHGTHTMGTILGGKPGEQVGVAPDAQWIHAAAVNRDTGNPFPDVALYIESFQWMAAPTGNPGDTWAVPRVCSNSWGLMGPLDECDDIFWQWIDNSEAAGTAHFFAAGNEAEWGLALRRPADRATTEYQSVAVAAVDPHEDGWPIGYFSSRGPTYCTPDGSAATKPDIAAPGWDIRSSVQDGGYAHYAGTSMASPHVAGVAALMLDACEHLTPNQIKQIIYDTAVDLGDPGKDNEYGWGMIDAVEAVNLAIEQCSLGLSVQDIPSIMPPGESVTFTVQVDEDNESVVPGSEVLMYSTDGGPYEALPLEPLDKGLYEATLPPAACDTQVQFYVQVEGESGDTYVRPHNAPTHIYSIEIGDVYIVDAFFEDFEAGIPETWSTSGLWKAASDCAVSGDCAGTQWAYYGQLGSCSYDTGWASSGNLQSPSIEVPVPDDGVNVEIAFCYTLDAEVSSEYDRALFSINDETPTLMENAVDEWTTYSVNAANYAGESITLRWRFETIDSFNNDFRGWQISNVRVTTVEHGCEDPLSCSGDLDFSGVVNVSDLLALLGEWGACAKCDADLNGDGTVNVTDMLQLLSNWGSCS